MIIVLIVAFAIIAAIVVTFSYVFKNRPF